MDTSVIGKVFIHQKRNRVTAERMADWQTFQQQLIDLEGSSYRDYKRIKGDYEFPGFDLAVDYVQGDPFAAPSRIRLKIAQQAAQFPLHWLTDYETQIAIADYLTRQVAQVAQSLARKRGSGKSGNIEISAPSQAILRRSAIWIDAEGIEARLTVGLPAFGRRIAGKAAAALLCEDIPQLVERSLKYEALKVAELTRHIHTFQDAEALRRQLAPRGLVAFIAAAACLPRRSGVDERPLVEQADLFVPPADGSIVLETPHRGHVKGLGIRKGVTLIVGGGYHGKSTLLKAIEQGVYNHVPGDGRQQVVTDVGAFKLRAEDGRSVVGVDISPVINHLPRGRQSDNFSTPNASGSTSQAAGLMEAVEAGATVIVIDEDTAATNFMIRDRKMQALIAPEKEPITPFIEKVRSLYDDHGVSTILVMGGSGDYFAVADTVIAMEDYQPQIVTERAKAIAQSVPHSSRLEGVQPFGKVTPRAILPESIPAGQGDHPLKIKARQAVLMLGNEAIDLKAVEQLVETQQVSAIAQAIIYAQRHYFDGQLPLGTVLDYVMADIAQGGLDMLSPGIESDEPRLSGNLAEFRRLELAATLNRLRSLKIAQIT
ncbi:MAG: ABC-ATPase domain-containing protein [Phormidesmis sp.]